MKTLDKKFEQEIKAIRNLSYGDSLTVAEMEKIKQNILSEIEKPEPKKSFSYVWKQRYQNAVRYIVSAIVGISLVGGSAFASNGSVPGDAFYPIKRVKESVQLSLAFSEVAKANLHDKFAHARLFELEKISSTASAEVEISSGQQGKNQNSLDPKLSETPSSTVTAALFVEKAAPTTQVTKPTTANEDSKLQNRRVRARQAAEAEVGNAINALERVQVRFEAQGDSQNAAVIQTRIEDLRIKANTQNVLWNKPNTQLEMVKGAETNQPEPAASQPSQQKKNVKRAGGIGVTADIEIQD